MDEFPPCVRSGFCCRRAPCLYGTWDAGRHQCVHLEPDREIAPGVVQYRCAIADDIKKRPGSDLSPAFGAGCGSTLFNGERRAILRVLKDRKESKP